MTRRNTYQRERAERAGGLLVAEVELAEGGLDGEDEERHRHERLGDDHAVRGERQRDAEPPVEVLADQAAPAERVEQRDAADDGRQHHRAACTAPAPRPTRERDPGEQPGQRDAEQDGERRSPTSSSTIDSRSAVERARPR